MARKKLKTTLNIEDYGPHPFCLMDDYAMTVAFRNNCPAVKEVLAPILGRNDFTVKSVVTQRASLLPQLRSVIFDCLIEFKDGSLVDVEMQNELSGMKKERLALYFHHLALNAAKKGKEYDPNRPVILIVICRGDLFHHGEPLYEAQICVKGHGDVIASNQRIIVADALHQDASTELGRLMADLTCVDPGQMHNAHLRGALEMIQSKKGRITMNEALSRDIDRLVQEATMQTKRKALKEGEKKGEEKGVRKGMVLMVLKLFRAGKMTESEAMEELGVSQEEFERLLSSN